MSIKVAIRHQTSYDYDRSVNLSPHTFRLRPAAHCRTPILSYSLKIKPYNHFLNWQQDPFGNFLARVVFPEKTNALHFEVEVIADMIVINPFDFFIEEYAENFPFAYTDQLKKELLPYFDVTEKGSFLESFVRKIEKAKSMRTIDFLVFLNQEVQKSVSYTIRLEQGVQTCEQTLGMQSGSCRDSAWLLVQVFRHLGLAARFASGYLIQLKADQKALDGPSGPQQDFTDLHAWTEVYIPGAGWIGLDPTSGLFASEGHIPLCCTPDPVSAAPVTGMTDQCEVTFNYRNEVFRIHEDPRVTKPYTDEQWATIIGLGEKVDEDLRKGDVRLTMGGEPTFVSVDDMEAKEWNTDADGPHKRVLGAELIQRLRNSFGPGGYIHKGQGKWYPGEPLPRWQYSSIWRNDGLPIWKNPDMLDISEAVSDYSVDDAGRLTSELTKFLNIPEENIHPALEDAFFFLWEEGKVPSNIDPYKSDLTDSLERKKLSQLLNKDLGKPVGYVIPLEWNFSDNRWISCRWEFRNDRLILIPGNSAIGLRLPLKSLPFISKAKMQRPVERSPFEELPALDSFHAKVNDRYNAPFGPVVLPKEFLQPAYEQTEDDTSGEEGSNRTLNKKVKTEETIPEFEVFTIKTALCIEVREGKIYFFMPPLQYAEHYFDLLASIEAAASKLKFKVVIEGYEPPRDNRVTKLSLLPDPGVLEVNVHPAKSWKELVHNYDIIFEQARLSRLGTEKFMLDGKHTGTGGGNHITIGGITPADSPLLRRPDLLRSLITYWQHHPGLSYLFSSQFIGPTSQAPRVDEGRQEMLYELEIAFSQLPEGKEVPFWLVDRIFRNLLIDITGNTHRAEFCIDKLYSPDSSTGRLGLLEFRAFDMPPNKQMCIVQLLLLRCIVSWFWKAPLKRKLVRWGTALYDKYMLPHYVQEDLEEVMRDIQEAGYPFQLEWLEPFFEFRFPLYGKIKVENIELELRMGMEPWHVLGEESASGGTARFVDSGRMEGNGEKMLLYRNNHDGTFTNVANEVGLTMNVFAMGSNFGDIDNDGFLDMYLGTGNPDYASVIPNKMFKNLGAKKFADVTSSARVGHLQKGHGVSFADMDNDGDQDIYIEMGGAYPGDAYQNSFFLNPGQSNNNWIGIQLEGVKANRAAIGSRVKLTFTENGVVRSVYRDVNSGGSFGSSPLRREIGIGQATSIDEIEIQWHGGQRVQTFKNVKPNQFIKIVEGVDEVKSTNLKKIQWLLPERLCDPVTGNRIGW